MSASPNTKISVEQSRVIYDIMKGFIGLLSPDGRLLDANQSAIDFIGVDLNEIVGVPFWDTPWWFSGQDVRDTLKGTSIFD